MKRSFAIKALAVVFASVSIAALAGCGNDDSSNTSSSPSVSVSSSSSNVQSSSEASSAGKSSDYKSDKPLVGKFEAEGLSGLFYTFNEDGTGEYELFGEVIKLNYSVKDGKLVIEFHSDEMGTMTVDYKIDETKLSIKDITGNYVNYIRR